jgi:hypothetical protein
MVAPVEKERCMIFHISRYLNCLQGSRQQATNPLLTPRFDLPSVRRAIAMASRVLKREARGGGRSAPAQ